MAVFQSPSAEEGPHSVGAVSYQGAGAVVCSCVITYTPVWLHTCMSVGPGVNCIDGCVSVPVSRGRAPQCWCCALPGSWRCSVFMFNYLHTCMIAHLYECWPRCKLYRWLCFSPRQQRKGPTVLVLCPTRELALQIQEEVKKINYKGIKRSEFVLSLCFLLTALWPSG